MVAKYTPSPWEVEYNSDSDDDGRFGQWYNVGPARVYWGDASEEEEAAANARLISAAPDLLEAAERVLASNGGGESFNRLLDAVAKAKGEKS